MFGAAYVLMHEQLSHIPSLDDPAKSVTRDTLEFCESVPWNDQARLVENGKIVDVTSFGFDDTDRVDLIELMLRDEDALGSKRIDQCFQPRFFETNFWFMWCSMFGFETWHSAAELRRYLLRFLRLFPHLATMKIIRSTRYNGYDRSFGRWSVGSHFPGLRDEDNSDEASGLIKPHSSVGRLTMFGDIGCDPDSLRAGCIGSTRFFFRFAATGFPALEAAFLFANLRSFSSSTRSFFSSF